MKKKAKKHRRNGFKKNRDSNAAVLTKANEEADPNRKSPGFGSNQIGNQAYFFLVICVIAQLMTILISWPAWQVRDQPVNLPWIAGTPQFSCGILLIGSLVFALVSPRKFGVALHLVVLAVAIGMDQFRCQPQILSVALLMAACVWPVVRPIGAWFLVSMWIWAGVHKLLSPDWMSHVPYRLLSNDPINAQDLYYVFAIFVALSEIALGILAWWKPRIAIFLCVGLHFGIAVFLLVIRWNFSVIPWNLCTAIVGSWLLWKTSVGGSRLKLPELAWGKVAVAILLLVPIGIYFGWVRHCFAHVLYSGNLPEGVITHRYVIEPLDSWKALRIPFPNVQQAYRDYFTATALRGEKLHIHEPRPSLQSHFYVLSRERTLREITAEEFYESADNTVIGMAHDDPRKLFQLEMGHAILKKRAENEMIYAIKFDPEFFRPELLEFLDGLPNLEQIQLEGCNVADDDLRHISRLRKLIGIGLSGTPITDAGLKHLKSIPDLAVVEHEDTEITEAGLLDLGL